jgi:fumarate reductase flavoprotein subunit
MTDVDVLVLGSGAAGLAAALSARAAGAARVLISEASDVVGGSSRLSGGIVMGAGSALQRAAGIEDCGADMFAEYLQLQRWDVPAGPIRRFAERSGATIDWLAGHGVPFFGRLIFGGDERKPRSHCVDGGGQALVDALRRACEAAGVDIALGRRVDRLITDQGGAVVGAAVAGDGLTAGAVVLATGGFGASRPLLEKFFPSAWDPERTWYIGHDGALGDAIGLGAQVGAQLAGVDRGLRTLGPGRTFINEAFLPGWAVLLDSTGRRFADETAPYGILDGLVRARGNRAIVLIDDACLHPPTDLTIRYTECYKQVWPNHPPFRPRHYRPDIMETLLADGRAHAADDPPKLAEALGLDPTVLAGEIERYNAHAVAGHDADFGKKAQFLTPLRTPPFYAVPVWPVTVNVTGAGLRVDDRARVLGADGRPVAGLFAAGECVGGLLGPVYMGSGNSLGLAVGMGRIAGEEAAGCAGITPRASAHP